MYRYGIVFTLTTIALGCSTSAKDKPSAQDPQVKTPPTGQTRADSTSAKLPDERAIGALRAPPLSPEEQAEAKAAEARRIQAERDKLDKADIPAMIARSHSVLHGNLNIDPGVPGGQLYQIEAIEILAGANPGVDTRAVFASGADPGTLQTIKPWVYFLRPLTGEACSARFSASKPAGGGAPAQVGMNICNNFELWEVASANDRIMPEPKFLERIRVASKKP